MFQSFETRADGAAGPARLARLRAAMADAGVDGFLVPRADVHMGENVAPRDERLPWLTGFTGSAGLCIALAERAAVFADGRYTLQAAEQVDGAAFEVVPSQETAPEAWLKTALATGARLGFDPWLHPKAEVERLAAAAEAAGATLTRVPNLVDAVWDDQPPPPAGRVRTHAEALAGESAADKRARLGRELAQAGRDAAVLTLPDSLCWLLNIRGADVARAPFLHGFAILAADGSVQLFADPAKFDAATRAHLGNDVSLSPPAGFAPALAALAGRSVQVDRASAPVAVADALEAAGAEIVWARDPCALPRACKTAAELSGARAAHLRDAAALARFLHWLDTECAAGRMPLETEAVTALEGFRAATGALEDISFDTICGAGPHGAIVHYRVTRQSDRRLAPGELLLVDSGAQYRDGTTDVTRTLLPAGEAPAGAAEAFTLVLKGMIAVSRARFPQGTTGRDLDTLARAALWRAGLDYDHGTGHGVGAFLGVHEGPASLSRRGAEPLRPGMIVSDEPGCYRAGAWGIRIENLLAVTEAEVPRGGERAVMGMETLTLAPIDRRLIDPALLGAEDRAWLDAYHARVLAEVGPALEGPAAGWLAAACAPL